MQEYRLVVKTRKLLRQSVKTVVVETVVGIIKLIRRHADTRNHQGKPGAFQMNINERSISFLFKKRPQTKNAGTFTNQHFYLCSAFNI